MGKKTEKNAHLWEADPDGWYVEEPWVWERLFEKERFFGEIVDPSCGMGRCVTAARAAGYTVHGRDLIARYPIVEREENFLESTEVVDNICTNPPFHLVNDAPYPYLMQALKLARKKVAIVARSSWIFGEERSKDMERWPLYRVYHLTPKPSMPPGAVIAAGESPGNGQIDYVIAVFLKGFTGHWTGHWLRKDRKARGAKRV